MEMIMLINSINCKDLSRKGRGGGWNKKGRDNRALFNFTLLLFKRFWERHFAVLHETAALSQPVAKPNCQE